jgi:quercetin dioxygenase-like cupin family protein
MSEAQLAAHIGMLCQNEKLRLLHSHRTTQQEPMDELELFLKWSLKNLNMLGMVPYAKATWSIEGVTSVLMYRKDQYQIQMFIVPENTIIPEHTHPNVDSYEVYVGGNIKFSHSGKYVLAKEVEGENPNTKTALGRGSVIRVKPNDKHGGVFGPGGGVFLSVQHWLNKVEPHCVAADYTGTVMGEDHYSKVICGKPELKATLTENDVIN